jgi:hypothetical protein
MTKSSSITMILLLFVIVHILSHLKPKNFLKTQDHRRHFDLFHKTANIRRPLKRKHIPALLCW